MTIIGALTSHLDPLTLLITVVVGLGMYLLYWSTCVQRFSSRNVPPYPIRPWPLCGHLFMLTKQPLEQLQKWRQKTGDVFSLDFAGRHMVVVNGFESLKDLLVKKADKLARPETFLMRLHGDYGLGIINSYGANWKEQRTLSLSILRAFGMGRNVIAQKIDEEVEVFINELAKFRGQPCDVKLLVHTSVANVLNSIIIGQRYEHGDPQFGHFLRLLNNLIARIAGTSVLNHFRLLRYLPGDPFEANVLKKLASELKSMLMRFITRERKKVEESEKTNTDSEDSTERVNFIYEYFKEKKAREARRENTRLDENNLSAIINNLFGAGSETSGNTVLFFMLHMLHRPEEQEVIYAEIKDVVGTHRRPNMQDKPRLNYLNAAIMETQRLSNIAPIGLQRLVLSDIEIKGYTIPAGTIVMPILDSSLKDEQTWGDPENFRPSRFLADDGSLLQPEQFIPFSFGKRVCLGEALARMELFLFLSALMQKFRLEQEADDLPDTSGIYGITISPKPFKVRMIEREGIP
ncbi:cytochrome P450 2C15 [Aplysia californica]|uniref:Cytochrome P450 2C15 n=1 Tax=Aplysia californica TaxID=6500 RepID=A0ABM0JFN0_APLCA|nr:cytochrome P450 2C15 [Aplysia californica]